MDIQASFWRFCAGATVFALVLGPLHADEPAAKPPTAAEIAALVKQLDDPSYQIREESMARLIEAGPAAVDAISIAAQNASPEVAWRSVSILQQVGAGGDEKTLAKVIETLTHLGKNGGERAAQIAATLQYQWQMNRHAKAVAMLEKMGAKIQPNPGMVGSYDGGVYPGYATPIDTGLVPIYSGSVLTRSFTIEPEVVESLGILTDVDPSSIEVVEVETVDRVEAIEIEEGLEAPKVEGAEIELPKPSADAPLIDTGEVQSEETTPQIDEVEPIIEDEPAEEEIIEFKFGETMEFSGELLIEDTLELVDTKGLRRAPRYSTFEVAPSYGYGPGIPMMPYPGDPSMASLGLITIGSEWKGGVEGLKYLRDVMGVSQLEMQDFELTASALKHVAAMPNLTVLTLRSCSFEPAAMTEFRTKTKPGVDVRAFNDAVLGIAGPPEQEPFTISRVQEGTGAADAGLLPGDVLKSIDGNPIANFSNLTFYIAGKKVGDELAIEVIRDGKTIVRKAKLGARSELPPEQR